MDIFDNEWKPLLKLFSRAAMNAEIMAEFSDEECDRLHTFMDALQDLALEKGKCPKNVPKCLPLPGFYS